MRHITQGFQLLGVLIYAQDGIVGHRVVSLNTYTLRSGRSIYRRSAFGIDVRLKLLEF